MRGFSSGVLSLAAMALSSLTTYLTFFDARYTMTTAIADASVQVQSGGSVSDGITSAYYRFYPNLNVILSNRGTRSLVLSRVDLVRSSDAETCTAVEDDGIFTPSREPVIIEPGTVQQVPMEFSLANVDAEVETGEPFMLEGNTTLYCLKWTIFDPNGRRREPLTEAMTITTDYEAPSGDDYYPDISVQVDFPKRPTRIVSRGLF